MRRLLALTVAFGISISACSDSSSTADADRADARVDVDDHDASISAPAEIFSVEIDVVAQDAGLLPGAYRCKAASPLVRWHDEGSDTAAASYAIVFKDITPGISEDYLHWVIYDIPSSTQMLGMGVPVGYEPATPVGAKQAPIWNGTLGYNGPCAPSGTNTYALTLYALDVAMLQGSSASWRGVEAVSAIEQHALRSVITHVTSQP